MELEEAVLSACKILVEHFSEAQKRKENGVWEGFHSRIFSHFLHPETYFVFAGNSQSVLDGDRPHLEHVVPCVILYKEVCRLLKLKNDKDLIAQYLAKHWKVAFISKDEAKKLDSKNQLNLKKTMPEGWDFETGDTFARLNLAGIKLYK